MEEIIDDNFLIGSSDNSDSIISLYLDLNDVEKEVNEFKEVLNNHIDFKVELGYYRGNIYNIACQLIYKYRENKLMFQLAKFIYFANTYEISANLGVLFMDISFNKEINFSNYKNFENDFRVNKQMKYIKLCNDILIDINQRNDMNQLKSKIEIFLYNFSDIFFNYRRNCLTNLTHYVGRLRKYYNKRYYKVLGYSLENRKYGKQ